MLSDWTRCSIHSLHFVTRCRHDDRRRHEEARRHKIDAIFVDGGGVGGGVVDRLMFLRANVREVQFGAKADRATQSQDGAVVYANKRAEMWGNMREWLAGGMIENNPDLIADLTGVEYGYVLREGRDAIQLEKKEDMRKRGLASPDRADALALTFAYPVAHSDHSRIMRTGAQHVSDYDPFRDMFKRREDHQYGRREPAQNDPWHGMFSGRS